MFLLISRLTGELNELKSRWELHMSEMSKSNVHRDVELEALREQVGQLRMELNERKLDIERLAKLLSDVKITSTG